MRIGSVDEGLPAMGRTARLSPVLQSSGMAGAHPSACRSAREGQEECGYITSSIKRAIDHSAASTHSMGHFGMTWSISSIRRIVSFKATMTFW